jgi:hypothetical protein
MLNFDGGVEDSWDVSELSGTKACGVGSNRDEGFIICAEEFAGETRAGSLKIDWCIVLNSPSPTAP